MQRGYFNEIKEHFYRSVCDVNDELLKKGIDDRDKRPH